VNEQLNVVQHKQDDLIQFVFDDDDDSYDHHPTQIYVIMYNNNSPNEFELLNTHNLIIK
jgi:hypothetical protein